VCLLREPGVEFKEHGKHAPNVRDLGVCVCWGGGVKVWKYEEGVTCSAVGCVDLSWLVNVSELMCTRIAE
jgi:hypothetical protein